MRKIAMVAIGTCGLLFAGGAWAALCDLGDGTFLDDVNDLRWLKSPPGASSTTNWDTAFANAPVQLSGGRLPSQTEYGQLNPQLAANASVVGTYTSGTYWSTERNGGTAFTFTIPGGILGNSPKAGPFYYWPVSTDTNTSCPASTGGCPDAGYTTRLTSTSTPTTLTDAITGNSIDADSPGGENWKEIHCGTSPGDLQKVGVSPTDPVDPQVSVGSWEIVGAVGEETVNYNYGTGGSYTWRVYQNGTGGLCWQEDSDTGAVIATGVVTSVACLP